MPKFEILLLRLLKKALGANRKLIQNKNIMLHYVRQSQLKGVNGTASKKK